MPADPIVPGWVLVLTGGIRVAGWVREIEVAGVKFLELCSGPPNVALGALPPERLQLIAASNVKTITPLDEQRAREMVRRQWAGVR